MQERAICDKCYGHLNVVQILYKLHKIRPTSGFSPFYYAPDTIFRYLVKDSLPLLCGKIGGLGDHSLSFLVRITERTHGTIKIAVVCHTEYCHNRTPPTQCHICTPFAHEPYGANGVNNQCTSFAAAVPFKQFSYVENLNSTEASSSLQ